MMIHQTVQKSQSPKPATTSGRRYHKPGLPMAALLVACCVAAASTLRADTVFLKDGTYILNCQVTAETDTTVSVRTPMGDMVVPRAEIYRILKQKSAYDVYTEQLSRIREGDINGLFKLAQWCRNTNGLHKESEELLAKIISLNENHLGARRLLGHVKVQGGWMVPPPLSIQLQVGSTVSVGDIRAKLVEFLKERKDMLVASDPASGGPLDSCTLKVSVAITRKAAGKFYGMTSSQGALGATVGLRAVSPWIGNTPMKTAVDGQVPSSAGTNMGLAVQNALGTNGIILHKFLDQLIQLRAKKIQEELRKKEKESKKKALKAA